MCVRGGGGKEGERAHLEEDDGEWVGAGGEGALTCHSCDAVEHRRRVDDSVEPGGHAAHGWVQQACGEEPRCGVRAPQAPAACVVVSARGREKRGEERIRT